MKLILFIICFYVTASIHSQNNISNTYSLKTEKEPTINYERKYLQYTETEKGFINFQSILIRKSDSIIYKGEKSRAISQYYHMPHHVDIDSSICDLNTLQPRAYYSKLNSEGYSEEVIFTSKSIQNIIRFSDTVKTNLKKNNLYYNSVMEDEIISKLDFSEDSIFKINVVNPGLLFMEYQIKIRVLGKENLKVPDLGTILCWKLDVNSGTKNNATVWYSVKNRIQIKKTFLLPDGSLFVRVLLFN